MRRCRPSLRASTFESAIHDDIDVISISYGQDVPLADDAKFFFLHEPITLGSLHARLHVVPVIRSAPSDG